MLIFESCFANSDGFPNSWTSVTHIKEQRCYIYGTEQYTFLFNVLGCQIKRCNLQHINSALNICVSRAGREARHTPYNNMIENGGQELGHVQPLFPGVWSVLMCLSSVVSVIIYQLHLYWQYYVYWKNLWRFLTVCIFHSSNLFQFDRPQGL